MLVFITMQENLRAQKNAGKFEGSEKCRKFWGLIRIQAQGRNVLGLGRIRVQGIYLALPNKKHRVGNGSVFSSPTSIHLFVSPKIDFTPHINHNMKIISIAYFDVENS